MQAVPGSKADVLGAGDLSARWNDDPGSRKRAVRPDGGAGALWAVVLAGGEGTRLSPLIRRIYPDGRPKQYAALTGTRSLLRHTLDRAALAIPAERTVVIVTRAHAPFFSAEPSLRKGPRVLVQPTDRGTGAGVLLPVHWIAARDPHATIAILPSDHFIGDDAAFMRHVGQLSAVAARHPKRIVLVGVRPDGPETGYGWIEPGPAIEGPQGDGVRGVEQFREKPCLEAARACMEAGGLWNTFVMVARASALIEAGRQALPELHDRLTQVAASFGTDFEAPAIERAYGLVLPSNFSQAILASSPSMLAVSTLSQVAWSDWGTPERVIATLRNEGIVPTWAQEFAPSVAPVRTLTGGPTSYARDSILLTAGHSK